MIWAWWLWIGQGKYKPKVGAHQTSSALCAPQHFATILDNDVTTGHQPLKNSSAVKAPWTSECMGTAGYNTQLRREDRLKNLIQSYTHSPRQQRIYSKAQHLHMSIPNRFDLCSLRSMILRLMIRSTEPSGVAKRVKRNRQYTMTSLQILLQAVSRMTGR